VDGQVWIHESNSLTAKVFGENGRANSTVDPRAFGISAVAHFPSIYGRIWNSGRDLSEASFREWDEGDLRIVRGDMPNGTSVQWWIDRNRGWSVVRSTETDSSGKLRRESRSRLSNYDGTWLPSEIQYYTSDFQNASVPARTVRIHAAQINRPEQPARLGPSDIGIDAGTNVTVMNEQTLEPITVQIWDGTTLVETTEWAERLRAGTAKHGPNFARDLARLRAEKWKNNPDRRADENWSLPRAVTTQPHRAKVFPEWEWMKYTREFISKYRLNDEQSQRAWTICRMCEDDRDAYLSQHRTDFEALERADRAAESNSATSAAEREKLAERRKVLEAPIRTIFEEQLKPKLEQLPTRQQRAHADPKPARLQKSP
jgi:hypothetical protein